MKIVYALSEKGALERANGASSLPAELNRLLHMVDGHRTHDQLMAAAGKNAITAGGLRWLSASGYIQATPMDAMPGGRHGATPSPDWSSDLPPLPHWPGDRVSRLAPALADRPAIRSELDVCHTLSRFMLQAVRRHLGEGGIAYSRKIERALTLDELLPHLNPLVDAIAEQVGSELAAEFADTAAFILSPR